MIVGLAVTPAQSGSAPSPTDSGVLWRGDKFCSRTALHPGVGSCPTTGPWDVTACVGAPSGKAIWSLRNEPAGVGRFEVHQGDQGARGGGDRCELVQQTRAITGMAPAPGRPAMPGGEIRVFGFEALYDASTQNVSNLDYQTFGQWHHSTQPSGCPTSSPLKIALTGPNGAKRLEVYAQECVAGSISPDRVLFTTPLKTGTWQRWVFEIKWSAASKGGFVRLWHDDRLVVPKGCASDGRCIIATQYSDADGTAAFNHFKLGNYRDASITSPTVVRYRNVRIGLNRAAL